MILIPTTKPLHTIVDWCERRLGYIPAMASNGAVLTIFDDLSPADLLRLRNALNSTSIGQSAWHEIREKRAALLAACDWTQLLDNGLGAALRAQWVAYRQLLRDIPQTYTDPDDVVWPTPPGPLTRF